MQFGTLKSITPAAAPNNDELPLDDTANQPDSLEPIDNDPIKSFTDKLLVLQSEIRDILSDIGYSDDEYDTDYDMDDDDQFDDDSQFGDDLESEYNDNSSDNFEEEEPEFDDEEGGSSDEDRPFGQSELSDEFGDSSPELEAEDSDTDPNFQGNIRTVAGANLVYKRKQEDGNYEELWIYNVGNDIKKETQIRRAILAGTDISPNQRESEDGTQQEETSTIGNVQYLKISGLPN